MTLTGDYLLLKEAQHYKGILYNVGTAEFSYKVFCDSRLSCQAIEVVLLPYWYLGQKNSFTAG